MEAQGFRCEAEKTAFEKACAGKDHFPSKEAAEAYLRAMVTGRVGHPRDNRRTDWAKLEAYRCTFCGNFHVGHPSGIY